MNVYQIILKTVATTVDLLVALVVITKGESRNMKTAYSVFCLLNLCGIWC